MLVYFGYTYCPDVCPTTLSDIGAALRTLPDSQRSQFQIGMVTVDPRRDSGPRLRSYLSHFFNPRQAVAYRPATPAQLRTAESTFGASSKIDKHKPGASYAVTHTALTYAVDHSGKVRLIWTFGSQSPAIAADMRHLLKNDKAAS